MSFISLGTAFVARASGELEQAIPKNGTDFQLDELQAIVGGTVEVHNIGYLPNGTAMLLCMNEDANNLQPPPPFNTKATELWWEYCGGPSAHIRGDVLICRGDQLV